MVDVTLTNGRIIRSDKILDNLFDTIECESITFVSLRDDLIVNKNQIVSIQEVVEGDE